MSTPPPVLGDTEPHSPLTVGDLVRLCSGGPVMAVAGTHTSTSGNSTYRCQWFVSGQLHEGLFAHGTLRAVSDTPSDVQTDAKKTAVSIIHEYGYNAKDQTREDCERAVESAILGAYTAGLLAGRNGR